jgi:photosystem II stability/assembly factor-like uncharacterized protein
MASGDQILATTDGGAHWRVQLTGTLGLSSVDFVSDEVGWAVGDDTLLATADGGARWTTLPESCPVIRSVHFISPLTGFAVAGGSNVSPVGVEAPEVGGVVLATSDGGRTWRALPTPAGAQTVCFSDPRHGWLGAGGRLYRSEDGGGHWTVVTATPEHGSAQFPPIMVVQCAGGDAAWAVDEGPDAQMSQSPHVGYHADAGGAKAIFAENYFQPPGTYLTQSAGADAGPFSAISPSEATFVDWNPGGFGSAPWGLATGSGARLIREGDVGHVTIAVAASFISPQVGWVAGEQVDYQPSRQQERIVFTDDGGRTWHLQYAGPWTS